MKVSIGISGIPGAGKGLFAEQDFKRGQLIIPVTGPHYTAQEIMDVHCENEYLLALNDGTGDCIEVTNEARYANDAKGITAIPGVVNNAQFWYAEDHSMYLSATRTIKKGQEIFVSYGKSYWSEHFREQKLQQAASR